MTIERGRLVLSKKGNPQIEIDGKLFNPAQREISQSILERLKELDGAEVEFERVGGQPKKICEPGSEFVSAHGIDSGPIYSGKTQSSKNVEQHSTRTTQGRSQDFHNPYNFVAAPPRKIDDPDLGDHIPVSQDQFHKSRYTGKIHVQMKVVTPILIPDSENYKEANGHKTYLLLSDKSGNPLIPASSVRGMLRSAYEAVTNSRFGRFSYEQHNKRLAYRMDAREGLRLIPARIANGQIHLLTGTSNIGRDGRPSGPQYAAWLPRYSGYKKTTNNAVKYPDGSLPQHGDEVVCWVERVRHHSNRFEFWQVSKILKSGQPIGTDPEGKRKIRGWVCITNATINRKHDERIFFCEGTPPGPFPVTDAHLRKWEELIENYQEIHEEDLEKRSRQNHQADEYLGPEPGLTAWSRHVYTKDDRKLHDSTLCYVRLNIGQTEVETILPVMISRELYQVSPWGLLDPTLRPARRISELSPADRVFGWVRIDSDNMDKTTDKQTAVRGLLRVGPVACGSTAEEAIEIFPEDGLPLAILAAPKPQQGRFYVARSPNGEAQENGIDKVEAGYALGKGLRGRKVYPHHRSLPKGHWENPMVDRTQSLNGPWQEYRRPMKEDNEQRDDQNRSIKAWVRPESTFSFDLHVMNLSKVELGALLWLLNQPENHFYRLGGGKPLGFGSLRLTARYYDLWRRESIIKKYDSWGPRTGADTFPGDAIRAFKEAIIRSFPQERNNSFEQVSFIKGFLRTCQGFEDGLPIHYPRATHNGRPCPPNIVGESFKWFVANEREGARHALPNLTDDDGLTTLQDP